MTRPDRLIYLCGADRIQGYWLRINLAASANQNRLTDSIPSKKPEEWPPFWLTSQAYQQSEMLVSWSFEPSQPLGIISGLKTNSNPSLSHTALKSCRTNHNISAVSYLVGALSPVNHKGLHQGWTQTSLYLPVFISQVIIPQVMFCEPICILRALSTGTCIKQGDLFYSAGLHRNQC